MSRYVLALLVAALPCIAAQAHAAGITFDTAPPSSVIIVENGLEWAWAAPCATHNPSCGAPGNPPDTLPIQGFREPTLDEWAGAWSSRDELLSRFIVNNTAVCGSPWLDSAWSHCDASDARRVSSSVALTASARCLSRLPSSCSAAASWASG